MIEPFKGRFNGYGAPMPENDEQKERLHRAMMKLECGACGAKPGHLCKSGKTTWPVGQVHMGRLPNGPNGEMFDSVNAINGMYE